LSLGLTLLLALVGPKVGWHQLPVFLDEASEDLEFLLPAEHLAQIALAEVTKFFALELIVADEVDARVQFLPQFDSVAVQIFAVSGNLRLAPPEQRCHHFLLGRLHLIHLQHFLDHSHRHGQPSFRIKRLGLLLFQDLNFFLMVWMSYKIIIKKVSLQQAAKITTKKMLVMYV